MKQIFNLNGIQVINKQQQQTINGGSGNLNDFCHSDSECAYPLVCAGCYCRPAGGPV